MIKKSTLIVLLAAIIVGAAAYYFDWKRGQKEAANSPADTTKPAFTLQADDISSLTISYPADPKSQPIHFEKQNGVWQITQPLQTAPMMPRSREFCSNSRRPASRRPSPARPIA